MNTSIGYPIPICQIWKQVEVMFIRSQEADRRTDAQAAFPLFFFLFILSGIPAHETVQIGSSSLGFFSGNTIRGTCKDLPDLMPQVCLKPINVSLNLPSQMKIEKFL